jgi:hypothetical protein
MNSIVVDADNNNIKINGKPSSVTMTSLFNEFNEKFGNGKFFRANNFRQLNQLINRGDCITPFNISNADFLGIKNN